MKVIITEGEKIRICNDNKKKKQKKKPASWAKKERQGWHRIIFTDGGKVMI